VSYMCLETLFQAREGLFPSAPIKQDPHMTGYCQALNMKSWHGAKILL